jgi:ribosomal protein S18 acetylase RimI-like enzyme
MKKIKIRHANLEDKEKLIDFFKHYKIDEIIKKRIQNYILYNFTIVAEIDCNVVGILQYYIKENPNFGLVEFEEFFVKEKYRNRGLGSKLLAFAIKSVKKYFEKINIVPRKIFLYVDQENKYARKLYEKFSFKKKSQIKNLFSDNKIDLIYCLTI